MSIAQTSAARIYWHLGTLLITMITARYLGPDGRGIYAAAVGWVMLFSTVAQLSLGQVALYVAAGKPPAQWLAPLVGTLLAIAGGATAIGWSVAAAMYALSHGAVFHRLDGTVFVLAFLCLPAFLWIDIGHGVLMALGRLRVMNAAVAAGATVWLVLSVVLLAGLGLGVPGALLAMLLGHVATAAVTLGWTLRGLDVRVSGSMARALFGGALKLHMNAIGTYLFAQANVLIINQYRPASETAYYQLAVQIAMGLQIVATSVSAVSYSVVSARGPDAAWPEQRMLLLRTLALTSLLAVLAYLLAPFALRLVFGAAFLPTVPLLRILLLGTPGMTLSVVMASQWIGRGLFLQAALLTLLIGVVTAGASALVVPSHGAAGAAWVMVGTYAISIVGNGGMVLWVERRARRRGAASVLL